MSAVILRFPNRGPFAVRVEHEVDGDGWMVIACDHAWLHGGRNGAILDADQIAAGFGVSVRSS
jgi:hypothetical protein